MSVWEDHRIEDRVTAILSEVHAHQSGHHFGRPYLTAYQLAIAFARSSPEIVRTLGYQVGGEGTGEHVSLAQYLARELSKRIHAQTITHIEGAFLAPNDVHEIEFSHGGQIIRSSLTSAKYDLSMFRLRPEGE